MKNEVSEVKIDLIKSNPYQPRTYFDEMAIKDLADSIRENGLVQPITLRKSFIGYELIAGERRLKACKALNYDKIPAYIIDTKDVDSMYMALIENIQREDLSAIEEAKAYLQIMQSEKISQQELAKRLGKSQPSVANKIRLLQLTPKVQEAIETHLISERHGRAMIGLEAVQQNAMLEKIVEKQLTVAQSERLIKNDNLKKQQVHKGYSRQVQVGINTIKKAVKMIADSGLDVEINEEDNTDDVKLTVIIHK